ncbi:MAG: dienelactone hydrolase family protein [Acidimicrobiia bacterium]|nr:dienelactone hydrolase family protein [Acidimicrobiia bacterium]
MRVPFNNRSEAGKRLASQLEHLRHQDLVILGLPRGGVPVAFEVAQRLDVPLDIIVVRKLGVPFQPEVGMGAIGEDGIRIVNSAIVDMAAVTKHEFDNVEAHERAELERRDQRLRDVWPRLPLEGRVAVVVDDGVATGSTARAACQVAKAHGASRIVLAVPVAPPGWTLDLKDVADEFICLETPWDFQSIGQWYEDFSQIPDTEVLACLDRNRDPSASGSRPHDPAASKTADMFKEIQIPAGPVTLEGQLTAPAQSVGVVVFAHGSGSSRLSRRNRFVAESLNRAGFTTLLFDLLTAEEEQNRNNVFDIELLGTRLVAVTIWLTSQPDTRRLPVGYFGASTGAAAALWASTEPGMRIAAIVSRGGRPDLAAERLGQVTSPTRLIVGGNDQTVLKLNTDAMAEIRCESDLIVVDGATHLFEEPGTLAKVGELAGDWFALHLKAIPYPAPARPADPPTDPFFDRAIEDAEGVEVFERTFSFHGTAEEAAQGSEVFANPDEAVPPSVLKDGSPGHESYSHPEDAAWATDDEDAQANF